MSKILNDAIYKSVKIIAEKIIKEELTLRYYEGTVRQYNKKTNTYEVESSGATLTCYVKDNDVYNIGDTVIVLKFPTYRYIFSKKSAIVI